MKRSEAIAALSFFVSLVWFGYFEHENSKVLFKKLNNTVLRGKHDDGVTGSDIPPLYTKSRWSGNSNASALPLPWDLIQHRESLLKSCGIVVPEQSVLGSCVPRNVLAAMTHPKPSAVIVGGDKCGSSALYAGLAGTRFYSPTNLFKNELPYQAKEIYFFNNEWAQTSDDERCGSVRRYLSRFPGGKPLTIDATPNYGREPLAAIRMFMFYPERLRSQLKFLWIVRNPSARVASWHKFCFQLEKRGFKDSWIGECTKHNNTLSLVLAETESVSKCLAKHPCDERGDFPGHGFGCPDYSDPKFHDVPQQLRETCFRCHKQWIRCAAESPILAGGMFAQQIRHWVTFFPRSQMLFEYAEALKGNPRRVYKGVFQFLNLAATDMDIQDAARLKNVNSQGKYKKQQDAQRVLQLFYEPYNLNLVSVLSQLGTPDWATAS